jgi:hypothetical protein
MFRKPFKFHPSQRRYFSVLGMTMEVLARKSHTPLNTVRLFCHGKPIHRHQRKKILAVLEIGSGVQEKALIRKVAANLGKEALILEQRRSIQKQEIISFLKQNQEAQSPDLIRAGLGPALNAIYSGRINDARKDAGVPFKKRFSRKERRARLVLYLRKHPEAGFSQVRRDGFSADLGTAYKNKLAAARIDAGLRADEPQYRLAKRKRDKTERRKFVAWLKQNPSAGHRSIRTAGLFHLLRWHFGGSLKEARKAAGIQSAFPGYVHVAEAARALGLSRERGSQLFRIGRLKGFREGKWVYISKESLREESFLRRQSC